MLCPKCQDFFQADNRGGWPADWEYVQVKLHERVEDLEASCPDCEFCALLLAALRAKSSETTTNFKNIRLATNPGGHSKERRGQICHLIASADIQDSSFSSIDVEIELDLAPAKKYDDHQMSLFARRRSEDDSHTGSPCSFELASWWFEECKSKHKGCHQSSSILPSRVIDVGLPDGSIEPRLYESNAESARYVTLSHCWGKISPLITTTSNLSERKCKISMAELPSTFRDAVVIVRKFNVRFLWIDSLCILQDSKEDWEIESSKMCAIYQNSYFTIAAAHAKDGSEGCFTPRNGFICQPHVFQRTRGPHTEPSIWIARTTSGSRLSEIRTSPLSGRGWAFQEEMLSRRSLYYNAEGLAWRCSTSKASEAYPDFSIGMDDICRFQEKFLNPENPEYRSDIDALDRFLLIDHPLWDIGKDSGFEDEAWVQHQARVSDLSRFLNELDYMQIMETGPLRRSKWHEIVEEYTSRCLSRPSDRLAALMGISDAIGFITRETCIAGLWQSRSGEKVHFLDLLWSVKDRVSELVPAYGLLRTQVAPSWSWASINRPIQYPVHGGVLIGRTALVANIFEKTASRLSGSLRGTGVMRRVRTAGGLRNGIEILEGPHSSNFQEIHEITWVPDEPLQPHTELLFLEVAHAHHEDPKKVSRPCKTIYAIGLQVDPKQAALQKDVSDDWPCNLLTGPKGEERALQRVGFASWPSELLSLQTSYGLDEFRWYEDEYGLDEIPSPPRVKWPFKMKPEVGDSGAAKQASSTRRFLQLFKGSDKRLLENTGGADKLTLEHTKATASCTELKKPYKRTSGHVKFDDVGCFESGLDNKSKRKGHYVKGIFWECRTLSVVII